MSSQYSEALKYSRDSSLIHDGQLLLMQSDYARLRTIQGACLWQLNRVDESLDQLLTDISRAGLPPDSKELAFCCLHIQSAYIMRGDYLLAKRYGLEAIVSARRTNSELYEAVALEDTGRLERFECRWAASEESLRAALAFLKKSSPIFRC